MLSKSVVLCALATLSACSSPVTEPGLISSFTTDSSALMAGGSATLSWKSANAPDGCVITPGDLKVAAAGTQVVAPTEDTTYRLTCNRAQRTLTVTVTQSGRVTTFEVTPRTVVSDSPVHVKWESVDAEYCRLTPDQGVLPTAGELDVVISKNTQFSMRCPNRTVAEPSAVIEVTVTPATGVEQPADLQLAAHDSSMVISWALSGGSANVYVAEVAGITAQTIGSLKGGIVYRKQPSPFTLTGLGNGIAYFVRLEGVAGTFRSALGDEKSATPIADAPREDPLYAEQWHLKDTTSPDDINVEPVWAQGLFGDGIKVAVSDEGLDANHEDLRLNIATLQSKDYAPVQSVWTAVHGTSCAGLVAARSFNGKGGRGVAPHAQLRSYNLLQDSTSVNIADAMRRDKDVVSVNTNSWGIGRNAGWLFPPDPLWLAAVEEGATTGRGGRGVLYFFAAGNGGDRKQGALDDANFGGLSNQRFVYAIGGVDRTDKRPNFAEQGSNLLVVAQAEGNALGGVVTTDVTGKWGYNAPGASDELADISYTRQFNGTSSATPIAAGVGALILQARPELGYRDVRRVLAMSAKKCDPGNADWRTNAAGLHVNHNYGFGLVDAAAAVALAKTIPLVGPEKSVSVSSTPALAIDDNTGAAVTSSVTLSNTGIGHIEFVQAEVTITHGRSGDLEIVLSKQGSVSSTLHPLHGCAEACKPINGYDFATLRHLDEPADGQWTLSVRDKYTGEAGTFDSWTLKVFGRE